MKKQQSHPTHLTQNEVAELFHVAPVTVFNWVKEGLLELDENRCITEKSLRRFQKGYAGKTKLHARANKQLKDGHDNREVNAAILQALEAPSFDHHLGDRYEAMLSESFKNKEGVFYTPMTIVDAMMSEVKADATTLFLDPCCGSGNFLVKALEKGVSPQHLYGFDTDPIAVMIARRRILEMTGVEPEHVVCGDFLDCCPTLDLKFDLAFTNPPWGKKLNKVERQNYAGHYKTCLSADTCSLFFLAVLSVLHPGGQAGLLFPDSFFKIAVFEEMRNVLLQQTLEKIIDHGKPFKNLYSAVSVLFRHCPPEPTSMVLCCHRQQSFERVQQGFMKMPRHNLNYWTRPEEMQFIEELLQMPSLTLKGRATWGLGIVTGNNSKRCKRSWRKGLVPVYRGKEILPGRLKAAQFYINPEDFPRYQQMAPLSLFQAPEKLVYRFISNKLVFYCDTQQRFILNSANMLVLEEGFPVDAKTMAKLLNSPLSNWLFQQLFHTHKVLRGDLEMLPVITDSATHRRFNLLHLGR